MPYFQFFLFECWLLMDCGSSFLKHHTLAILRFLGQFEGIYFMCVN